ncbi:MAG: RDD family protein [Methanothrix sp.]|nr:RDD family protein [Methanothrix sp.]
MSIDLNKIEYIFIEGRDMTNLDQTDSAAPVRMEYQGIGIRFVSLVIDSLIISAIFGALATVFGVGMMRHGSWSVGLLSFAFYIAYYTYLEGTKGQTIGKMITKIKVVREDGTPIDMEQAFKRNILRVIDGLFAYLIGAILIWRSDKQQRLGDSVAKTVVIKA